MDVLKLIDEVEDIVEAGNSLPFSSRVMVDKEELLDIIKEIRIKLPDEIKQAAWIKEERERILEDAKSDADTLLSDAEYKLEEMLDEEGISKMANKRAEEIVSRAQINAKEIRLGAIEYADSLLLETQENLKEVMNLLNANRKELKGGN